MTADWKLLLGSLQDEPSQEVAAARGWMNYLIGRWHTSVPAAPAAPGSLPIARPPLTDADARRKAGYGPPQS